MRTKELEAALAYADNDEDYKEFAILVNISRQKKCTMSICVQEVLAAEVRRLEAENAKAKHTIADLLGCKPMEASQ